MQPYLNNSLAIRQEIQRFESVHPSIYAIYDLIEAIPDPLIQQQIREHVVSIEGKLCTDAHVEDMYVVCACVQFVYGVWIAVFLWYFRSLQQPEGAASLSVSFSCQNINPLRPDYIFPLEWWN